MRSRWSVNAAGWLAGAGAVLWGAATCRAQDITVLVDLSDVSRRLVRSFTTIHGAPPGELALRYPEFVPGNHAASGPIRNVAGITIRDGAGRVLAWERDPFEACRIIVEAPDGGDVFVETRYIASQPWHMSRSSDTYGFANFGAINWNTLLWYPEGGDCTALTVEAHLESPRFDTFGCSLPGHTARSWDVPGLTWTGPLTELIDSPVIFGEHLKRYNIPLPDRWPEHVLWINAGREQDTELPDWMMSRLTRMVEEAAQIFGKFPRGEYHFLCMADDALDFGLEHATCTFLSADTDAFSGEHKPAEDGLEGGMRHLTVIPHEYIHAWCGKLRAPEGLIHTDYHTPIDTSMLWVYEGLTTYYTQVLAARSGMTTPAEFEQWVLDTVGRYSRQTGRQWRSVRDTARDVEHVRDASDHWPDLRRGADYYSNAALFWLEADALIRADTKGERSLDDFSKAFFDVEALPVGKQATYTRDDVVRTLGEIDGQRDWDGLIRERIETPDADLSFRPLLAALGLRITTADEPGAIDKKIHPEKGGGADRRHSLGVSIDDEGVVTGVVPGSPADKALLAEGMKIVGVGSDDGWVYSRQRLDEAIAATPGTHSITLTIAWGERIGQRTLEYSGGPAWPVWDRLPGREDVLGTIARAKGGE